VHKPLIKGAVSALVLFAFSVLLLRASLGALSLPGDVVWVNPSWAKAGLGAAALLVHIGGWIVVALVRDQPIDLPPLSAREKIVFVSTIVLAVGVTLLGGDALTDAYASVRGFVRCPASDRFQAGNVPKNDVTLHAYARSADITLRARCTR
jgi:hypothetical protein